MEEDVTLLCVDDEPNVLSAIRRVFLDEPYTILTARSGQEGLDLLERQTSQVIISDYRMPGMNGVEFLGEACKKWPDTVRIVLSGYADTAAVVSAINEGQIYKFIPKPWNDEDLRVTVSNALERYFLTKRNRELTTELQKKNEELTELNLQLEAILNEKLQLLEFKTNVLTAHQNILDAMPVGILGIDSNHDVVLCNHTWLDLFNMQWGILGRTVSEIGFGELTGHIESLLMENSISRYLTIRNRYGKLSGCQMRGIQQGTILVFTPLEPVP